MGVQESPLDVSHVLHSVDPTGEFSKHGFRNAEAILRNEMSLVQKQTKQKLNKLSMATDTQIGLELMHMFVLDILGRDTPAAKIFQSKSSIE